jgi:hypothetical protein
MIVARQGRSHQRQNRHCSRFPYIARRFEGALWPHAIWPALLSISHALIRARPLSDLGRLNRAISEYKIVIARVFPLSGGYDRQIEGCVMLATAPSKNTALCYWGVGTVPRLRTTRRHPNNARPLVAVHVGRAASAACKRGVVAPLSPADAASQFRGYLRRAERSGSLIEGTNRRDCKEAARQSLTHSVHLLRDFGAMQHGQSSVTALRSRPPGLSQRPHRAGACSSR